MKIDRFHNPSYFSQPPIINVWTNPRETPAAPLWLKSLSQPPSYQYWLNQERACFGSSNFHGFLLSKKAPREKADFFMDGEFLGANVISSNITTPHCGLGGECFRRQRNLKQYHHTALWLRIGVFLGANVI